MFLHLSLKLVHVSQFMRERPHPLADKPALRVYKIGLWATVNVRGKCHTVGSLRACQPASGRKDTQRAEGSPPAL